MKTQSGGRRRRSERRAAARAARKRGGTLAVLTTSAMALLPALAQRASAEGVEGGWSAEYGYARYAEGKLPASKLSFGSRNRYEIDTHSLALRGPIGSRASFGLDVSHETMSGASPWFVEPDLNGAPVVVMTGASIQDARTDVLGSFTFERAQLRTTLTAGTSIEDDYTSINFGVGGERDFNEKSTTLSWSASASLDRSDPTATSFAPDPRKRDKRAGTLSLGLGQTLDRRSVVQSSLTFQYAGGFLADPYKLVSSGGELLPDRRPDARAQLSWLTRYRRHFEGAHASLHADYQLYWDDWAVLAHTLELGWHQEVTDYVTLTPAVRYYSQRAAEFYAPFFAAGLPATRAASSDYRLSGYGALAFSLRADLRSVALLAKLGARLGVQWEHYESGAKFSLSGSKPASPGLVDYDALMVTLRADF